MLAAALHTFCAILNSAPGKRRLEVRCKELFPVGMALGAFAKLKIWRVTQTPGRHSQS
jgi:hypothetical protein